MRHLFPLVFLAACGQGEWVVTTWGEDFIEQGIPAAEFEDGCAATFDRFVVSITEASLLDGDGDVVASVEGGLFDLTEGGTQEVGATSVKPGHYASARFRISGPSAIEAAGELTCGADAIRFDWTFNTDTTYLCEPDITVASGGSVTTELTIHADHFFYDGLADPDAALRGQAIVNADANGDGEVTLAELDAVPVAPLGYSVGHFGEVTTLGAFIAVLTDTLGHVDGEGHCLVSL